MSNVSTKKFVNLIGYIAICAVAIALIVRFTLSKIFPDVASDIIAWCNTISFIFSMIATAMLGFFYAKSKRSKTFMIFYFVCIVVIICFYFIW